MQIQTTVTGAEAVSARMGAIAPRLRARLALTMQSLAESLKQKVQDEALSGQILQTRSGRLKASIAANVIGAGTDTPSAVVSANTPYARIQELGGQTKAHLIEPRLKMALAFDGKVFARVRHPGSKIPAHGYLSRTLAAFEPTIKTELAKCLKDSLQ